MISEKQLRSILFLLQIVYGISIFIAAYTALTALVDFSRFSLVFQQLSKYGKVVKNPFANIEGSLLRTFILLMVFSLFQILAGLLIRLRSARALCAVVFAIEWLSWPLGTILGSLGLYLVTREVAIKKPEVVK